MQVLSKSDREMIHTASLRMLERTGMLIRSDHARAMLREAGARVSEENMRVYIPEQMVNEAVKAAPRSFTLGARSRKNDLKIPAESVPYMSTDGFAVAIRDSETLEKRPSTREDLRKWATLADACSGVDLLWPSVGATDLPPHVQLVAGLATSYENTEKHVQYQAFSGKEARLMVEMAAAVAGGEEENRKRPHFSSIQCIVAPLQYDEGSTEALTEFARAGMPVVAMTMVSPGITGPTTLAGSVALANAEVLGSLVISETASRGAPVFYCFVCAPLDMKSGIFVTGSPEYGILSAAGAEMAKHYGLPSMMGGMGTSAKAPGAQVGFEKAISTMPILLSGCDLITGLGGLADAGMMSMEEMLIDSQVWEDLKRVKRGMEVSEKELALDVIEKVGPKGQFLAHPHTLANFRKLHVSRYSDRSSYTAWESSGRKDIVATVQAEVRRILSEHSAAPLEKSVRARLEQIERRAEKELI